MESLRAGKRAPRRLFVLDSAKGLDEILKLARAVPRTPATRQELDRMCQGGVHQGVILIADPLPVLELRAWLEGNVPSDAFVAVLDSIEDPQNFGAIVRSAAALGAAAVIYARDRAAPLSPAAVKASAGGVEYVDLIQAPNVARALRSLKDAGFWVAALDAEAPKSLWETDLTGRTAVVIGNEGTGIRRLVRESADYQISIPLSGAISSLNASVSAAIAFAECRRQRQTGMSTTR